MSATAKQVVQDFFASGGLMSDPERLAEVFAEDYVNHTAPPGTPPGPEGAIAFRAWLQATFSDVEYEVVDVVGEGDRVAVYTLMRGTHTGAGLGAAPTGKRFEAEQMHFIRVADGRIAEHWGVRDDAAMLRQLGLIDDPRREAD